MRWTMVLSGRDMPERNFSMLRILFRLLALASLALAVVLAVGDTARSVAAEALVLKPLGALWTELAPAGPQSLRTLLVEQVHPFAWDPVATWVLAQPASAVFAVLALIFHVAAWRPVRRHSAAFARR